MTEGSEMAGRERQMGLRGTVVTGGIALAFVVAGCGGTNSAAPPTTTERPSATDVNGYGCYKSELDFARRCPNNPKYGKTQAQLRADARAKASAARRAQIAAARRAAAAEAQIAAENAWHKGYNSQDENVYWRWVHGTSCKDYAQNGCWHVEVITRDGCSSYVAVEANEYSGGSIINSLLDNQGFGIPPKTARMFELDADRSGNLTAGDLKVTCN